MGGAGLKININYASYPYRAKQIFRWINFFAFLLTLFFLYFTFNQVRGEREEVAKVKKSRARLEAEIRALSAAEARGRDARPVEQLDKKVKILNEMILRKSFSWTQFLNDLEKAIPSNISVKKIEPRFLDHGVNLSGEALTLKDLTQLILSLETRPQYSQIFLLDQKVSKENRVEFLIHLNYLEKGKNDVETAPSKL